MAGFRSWATVIANLLVPVGILTFSSGFFPYKPLIPGLATFEEGDEHAAPAVFDKVIFMVVDALRRYDWYRTPILYGANVISVTLYIQMTPDSRLHKGQSHTP